MGRHRRTLRDVAKIPIACSLEATEASDRTDEWSSLIRRSCTDRSAVAGGVRLAFTADAADELTELAAAEQLCCAWADWHVEQAGAEVVLTATTDTPEGAVSL